MLDGRTCRALVIAVLASGAFAATPPRAAAACPKGAECARLTVPLDHTGHVAGTLPLAYARVPAAGARAGTLVVLSGGPGQAAVPLVSDLAEGLKPLHGSFDIVAVDQRGTGDSGAVSCAVEGPRDVAVCARELGDRRAFFSTPETARDLEDLRRGLGVEKLTLLGVSYGAKVAGEYARRFPSSTAAVVLDSPAPVDGLDGFDQLRVLGTPRVLREVCYPGLCHATVTDPDEALRAAASRVQKRPVRGPLVSASGRVQTAAVSESDLYSAISGSDLSPTLRLGLPAAIASLAAGDAAPLLHLSVVEPSSEADAGEINPARLLATSCIEARLPWAPDSAVASRADALRAFVASRQVSFAPFRPLTVLAASVTALCENWPPTPRPEGVPYLGPDVPVLVLSGRDDLRTPLEDARRTALQYPNARVLAVPGVGHSVLTSDVSGCALRGMVAFLRGGVVSECSARERRALALAPAAPYAPATLAKLRPTRLLGVRGQTISAVRVTLTGIGFDTLSVVRRGAVRLPGLRAGYVRASRSSLTLHGVSWIEGVRVSGRLDSRGRGTVTVRGPAPGTITFSRDGARGVIGGREFTLG